VFGYRELAGVALALAGCEVTPQFVHNGRAKFDLALSIDDLGESAVLNLEYATDLLEAASAERLLGHFEQLLEEVLRRPDRSLATLQLAPRAERQLIAACESGPVREVPAYPLGLETLAGYAEGTIVLRSAARDVSAAELRRAVGQLSDALRSRGIGPGEFVALCLARGPAWVVAVLAVLETGAAYAPFDISQPAARIGHGIARCRARVVITRAGAYRPEADSGVDVIDLAELERFERGTQLPRTAARRPSQRPVYAIMTSGSTGQPRMAAVARAGLCNLLGWYADVLQLTEADTVLLATSVGFDLTQKNLFVTLLAGARLLIDEPHTLDPERLCALIEREAVTVLNCTPSLAYALVASAAARDLKQLRSLRVLVLGGEPIDARALRVWTEHASCRARIVNSYGPTECSDVVSACDWRGRGDDIGSPIPNARCRVVDVAGGVAALGVPGELWLSGTPLGLGYLADPDADTSKFVRDRGHWYRTGDLVRRGAAGELRFLGRLDTQLKIRGYRIELGEIESVLKNSPGVRDAVVVSRPDARGRPALVAYVVPMRPAADGGELCAGLRERMERHLPSYMLPQSLLTIGSLPRTASGKLDRNALPAPRFEAEAEADAARASGLVSPIARIVCEVLGLRELGADADFFQLGGHSLAAVELIARLESELGCRLRVAAVFEHPVLGDFAAHVLEQLRGDGEARPRTIAGGPQLVREPAPCS
jgi:amino acid adenylation domain-containing protein